MGGFLRSAGLRAGLLLALLAASCAESAAPSVGDDAEAEISDLAAAPDLTCGIVCMGGCESDANCTGG